MGIQDIIKIVEQETGVSHENMAYGRIQRNLLPRYVAMMLMYEEDVLQLRIAKFFGITPRSVCSGLVNFKNLIETDKRFKNIYLSCIQRISKAEDTDEVIEQFNRPSDMPVTVNSDAIFKAVEKHTSFNKQLLVSRSRTREVSDIRCIAIQLHMELLQKHTVVKIGKIFNRDHSTILFADKKFQWLFGTDQDFKADYESIKNLLKEGAK